MDRERFEEWLLVHEGMEPITVRKKLDYLDFIVRHGIDVDAFLEDEDGADEVGTRFLAWVRKARGPEAYNNYVKLLNNLAAFAGHQDIHFARKARTRPRPRTLTAQELQILTTYHAEGRRLLDLRTRALVRWALFSGMRPSEVHPMRVGDLDPVESTFEVREPRKRGYRRVLPVETGIWASTHPFGAYLRNHPGLHVEAEGRKGLARAIQEGASEPLWVSVVPPHPQLSQKSVRLQLHTVGRNAGVDVNWNRTRHTRATQLLEAGLDVRYIQFYLGHIDLDTTAIYAEVDTRSVAKAMRSAGISGFPSSNSES